MTNIGEIKKAPRLYVKSNVQENEEKSKKLCSLNVYHGVILIKLLFFK